MLILRQFPDPRRLEPTPQNEGFRRAFYARWGRENCIVMARSRRIEFPLFRQRLSIKCAMGGRERYLLDEPACEVDVDDDHYLVLNDGRRYGSCIAQSNELDSFSIFFRPGMAAEVLAARRTGLGRALDGGSTAPDEPEFHEFLRPHDRGVSAVLRYIGHHLRQGLDDAAWYEEQLYFLLARMLDDRERVRAQIVALPAVRHATRAEIYRRVMLAANYIHSNFDRDIHLGRLAAEACLSKFHFLRVFRLVTGLTPYAFVLRKRVQVARRLIAGGDLGFEEIAQQVGFATRSGLFRQMRRWTGHCPSDLRSRRRGTRPAGARQPGSPRCR